MQQLRSSNHAAGHAGSPLAAPVAAAPLTSLLSTPTSTPSPLPLLPTHPLRVCLSATLMNKGLEVIEAHYLFGASYDNIDIVIHPQSIIHSMIETADSSVLAQLGWPDMRLPILYTMSWPERVQCSEQTWPRLDFIKMGDLTFRWARARAGLVCVDLCAEGVLALCADAYWLPCCSQDARRAPRPACLNALPAFLCDSALSVLFCLFCLCAAGSPTTPSTPP